MSKQTALYHWHTAHGAKIVEFAGYFMPVQYEKGIVAEHLATRQHAGFFDVSHMGQILISGDGAGEALEKILPTDVLGLAINQQRYSFLTNERGGIEDDLMITRRANDFYLVVNAGCKDADFELIQKALPKQKVEWWANRSLIAVQGAKAVELISTLNPEIQNLAFMRGGEFELLGYSCWVSRSGYTGEDGVEISIDDAGVEALCNQLLTLGIEPVGLGARDSLRLEAGLCLYGNDINATTSPIEANLLWAIPKVRRPDGERAGGYIGAEALSEQILKGAPRKLVGLKIEGKMPIRAHTPIFNGDNQQVGEVTSGGFSPTLNVPIAMALIEKSSAEMGNTLFAEVRGKRLPVEVCGLPFVKKSYK